MKSAKLNRQILFQHVQFYKKSKRDFVFGSYDTALAAL